MRKALAFFLASAILCTAASAQTTTPAEPQNQQSDEEVVRITAQLIQVDAVITDKSDQIIPDLKLSDFSVYENGKKQELQFIEYVGADSQPRVEGSVAVAGRTVEPEVARNVSARDLRRVFAFVVDDLTIPAGDLTNVRLMLTDFVDKRMVEGDLVAIVRVVGGVGVLQQFTSDKDLLRRAIAELTPRTHPYSAFNNFDEVARSDKRPEPFGSSGGEIGSSSETANKAQFNMAAPGSAMDEDATVDGYTNGARALAALAVTGGVVDSMKPLPGRKSLVLISGGMPAFDSVRSQTTINGSPVAIQEARSLSNNVDYLIRQLTDKAARAGVVINTLDVRGLSASSGVSRFTDPGNEAKSGLARFDESSSTFGRSPDMAQFDNMKLDSLTGHQGLQALSDATGGVSVVNTNNFREGLERVVGRSSYYILAYRPNEPFDGKFHKLQIKVDRPGAHVYTRVGYVATPDSAAQGTPTKEQAIIKAAMAPLAKRDVDVSGAFQYRFLANNSAAVDVDLRVDAGKLDFKQESDGKYHTTLDVVGFVVNRMGQTGVGFSETVKAALTPDEYKRALTSGIGYTGHVELPAGVYQLRVAVRETDTGKLGSLSKYLEVPDMSKKRFTMSSVFLHAVDPAAGAKAQPVPLTALRQISRKEDLRYSAVVYNAKLDKDKPQLNAQLTISRGDRVIFQGPVQGVDIRGGDASQVVKVGQIGISKLAAGRYVLTLAVTDTLGDKKTPTLVRSIDFSIVD
jgi:VWFA-related protein